MLKKLRFVSGHDFSRAANRSVIRWGFSPCAITWALKRLCIVAALAVILFTPAISFACPACRDVTAGSAPQMQAGIRKGIIVLGIPAGAIFLGILGVAWKMKPQAEEEEPADEKSA